MAHFLLLNQFSFYNTMILQRKLCLYFLILSFERALVRKSIRIVFGLFYVVKEKLSFLANVDFQISEETAQ